MDLAIKNNQNFYDALVYRGKLYFKQNELEKALMDFNTALEIETRHKNSRSISPVAFSSIKHLFTPMTGKIFFFFLNFIETN